MLFNDPFDIHPDTLHFDGVELQQARVEEISSLLCNPDNTVVADPRLESMKRRGEIGKYSDYPFNVRELYAVYFGWKCTKEHRAEITCLLSHGLGHVRMFSTYPDPRSRRYVFEEMPRA